MSVSSPVRFVRQIFGWSLLCLVLASTPAFAQRTASLEGKVVDASGAVLPGVTIAVQNLDTGVHRTTVTDEHGSYAVPVLEPGRYKASADLAGFQPMEATGIVLTVGSTTTQNFKLQISNLEERVTVSAAPVTIDTTSSSVKALVTDEQIASLPLNGRNFTELALLQPGVTRNYKAQSHVQALGRGPQLTISGARPTGSIFMLDGTIVNNKDNAGAFGMSGNSLGADAIREFQVQINTFSAEYSRATGGVMNIVTKSGTNNLQGSVFGYLRNDALNAKNVFDVDKPDFTRYQFGGSLGGPIKTNTTFFFVNYEGLREDLGQTFRSAVPNANARMGILPGRPAFTVNPAMVPFLEQLYPLPNTGIDFGNGTGEFAFSAPLELREDFVTARVDHQLSGSDTLFARYTINDSFRRAPYHLPAFADNDDSRAQWLTIEHTRIISPRLLNTLRAGWAKSFTDVLLEVPEGLTYIQGRPLGRLEAGDIGHPGSDQTPITDTLNHFEIENQLGFQLGKHRLQIGAHLQNERFDSAATSRLGGRIVFGSLEDYLKGTNLQQIEAMTFSSDIQRRIRQWIYGAYVQDTYRAAEHLTLNLGLRYEPTSLPSEADGKVANMVNLSDPAPTVGATWKSNPTLKNFSPRVGAAWDPFGDGKTVIQAGVGLYPDLMINKSVGLWIRRVAPFFSTVQLRGADARNLPFPGVPAEAFIAPQQVPLRLMQYDIDQPRVTQWNATVQRELPARTTVSIGYAGSRGRNLLMGGSVNGPTPILVDGRKFFPAGSETVRKNPNFPEIEIDRTIGSSDYHAMLVSTRTRLKGFHFQTSYTLSSNIDDGSILSAVQAFNEAASSYDPDDPSMDRGYAAFHSRHNLVVNFSYDLPRLENAGAAGKLFGGWGVRGILSLSSGSPFTVGYNFDRNRDGFASERPDLVPGASSNPVRPGDTLRYFDFAAFQLQEPGYYGNLGRNTLIGPGVATFDLGLVKATTLASRLKMEVRAELFNLFNRANYQVPGAGLSSGVLRIFNNRGANIEAAARINQTSTSPRQAQVSARLIF